MYEEEKYIPEEVVIPVELPDIEIREEILTERKGSAVRITTPKKGDKLGLIEMANKNAESAFELKRDREEMGFRALEELQQKLRLTTSNIPGGNYVIHYCAELNITGGSSALSTMQVQLDDATTLGTFSDKTRYDFGGPAGFAMVTLSTGVHNIDIDYRATQATYAAEIRRARIMLWKVP